MLFPELCYIQRLKCSVYICHYKKHYTLLQFILLCRYMFTVWCIFLLYCITVCKIIILPTRYPTCTNIILSYLDKL